MYLPVLIVRGLKVITRDWLNRMGRKVDKVDNAIKAAFGLRVRDIRTRQGLSQESLAEMCDLDRSYIGGVERGERNVSLVNIQKIANALSVSPREFFEPR